MWLQYEKLSSNSGPKLAEEKNKFLMKNKDKIFKCLETNRFGDIFHLLDGFYDSVAEEVSANDDNGEGVEAKDIVAPAKETAAPPPAKETAVQANDGEKSETKKDGLQEMIEEGIRRSIVEKILGKIKSN